MAQKNRADLTTQANVIKNERIARRNTALRVGTMNIDEIDSFLNFKSDPNVKTWYLSKSGSNANVGSAESKPFLTMAAAISAATEGDHIIFLDSNVAYDETLTLDKRLIFSGSTSNSNWQGFRNDVSLRGTWTISVDSITFNSLTVRATLSMSSNYEIAFNDCYLWPTLSARFAEVSMHNSVFISGPSRDMRSLVAFNSRITQSTLLNIGEDVKLYAGSSIEGSITCGLDTSADIALRNSSIGGDLTITGNLDNVNSVIGGTLTVSGTTTSKQAKVFDDAVLFKDKIGVAVTPINALDVNGGAAIGSGYAGISTAPTDGLLIEGNVGIGVDSLGKPFHFKSASDTTFRLERVGGGIYDITVGNQRFSITKSDSSTAFVILFDKAGFGTQSPAAKVDIDQSSITGAIPVLRLCQTDLSEEMIKFDATIGVGNPIEAIGAKSFTQTHFLKINVEGLGVKYMPIGDLA